MTYAFSHPHPLIGSQWRSFVWDDSVRTTLEGARTFGFLSEVEALHRRGLALGGSLENAVVFDESGVCNPEGLRFSDECVRHKYAGFLRGSYAPRASPGGSCGGFSRGACSPSSAGRTVA